MDDDAVAEPRGVALVRIAAVHNLVARLLVSDPRSRARVSILWDEPWMRTHAPVSHVEYNNSPFSLFV
jgi:hypothetical protein